MTFLEAAVAILQRERKPLPVKKLTELALRENLLTVVGRTPEETMRQRLEEAFEKDSLLTRPKPGVFGLRHYPAPEAEPASQPAEPAEADAQEEKKPAARRRRRGGRGRKRPAPSGEPVAVTAEEEPTTEATIDEPAAEIGAEEAEALETPSGPLIAPAFGTEEVVRGEDHRPIIEGIEGETTRGRRRGRREKRRGEHGKRKPAAVPAAPPAQPAQPFGEARPTPVEAGASIVDGVVEILRQAGDRSLHFRQIADMGAKRRFWRGEPPEVWRALRAAILAELRRREAAAERPRVRPVGGGQYGLADRRLDGELAETERQIAERAARLSEATRSALERRIARLQPVAFEALGRVVLDRLGVTAIEPVKRGDGVAYLGGLRMHGAGRRRLLCAMRPGGGDPGRRAVGELRAGLGARGFDEGLLLAAGQAGTETLAELAVGPSAGTIELYDGAALATLCIRLGIGVQRRTLSLDLLDVELLEALEEG